MPQVLFVSRTKSAPPRRMIEHWRFETLHLLEVGAPQRALDLDPLEHVRADLERRLLTSEEAAHEPLEEMSHLLLVAKEVPKAGRPRRIVGYQAARA